MFIVAITTVLGLDHNRDTLFNAVCHASVTEFGGRYIAIDYPFSYVRPFAPAKKRVTPVASVESDWQDATKRRVVAKLKQAKSEGRFVIMNDLGHGIMQRATFHRARGDLRQAEHLHHVVKVAQIVKPLDFGVPHYLRLWGTASQMSQAMLACPGRAKSSIASSVAPHVEAQMAESERYFVPEFGQRRTDISVALTLPEQLGAAMNHIRDLVKTHGQQHAA